MNENELDSEGEDMESGDDVGILRIALAEEVQSISQFEEHLVWVDNEEIEDVIESILDCKKDAVARLIKLLVKFDPDQGEKLKNIGLDL